MKVLKNDVQLAEVLSCYKLENLGSESFQYAVDLLTQKSHESGNRWTLLLLSKEDVLAIMLPDHRHPKNPAVVVIPPPGMAVASAAGRVRGVTQEAGPCWENIRSHQDRDFSKAHIFLRYQAGRFMNLDGLHRLLAWAVFERTEEIPAYVVGWQESMTITG
jgi:hypothetical protein